MLRDNELKVIAEMTDAANQIIREHGINPMQAMTLVGYAARQVVTDLSCSVGLSQDQAVIIALGGMLPLGYLQEVASRGQGIPKEGVCGCKQ